ncbi:MAG: hypothetical protein ACYC4K_08700 [Thiobacillus sp.]
MKTLLFIMLAMSCSETAIADGPLFRFNGHPSLDERVYLCEQVTALYNNAENAKMNHIPLADAYSWVSQRMGNGYQFHYLDIKNEVDYVYKDENLNIPEDQQVFKNKQYLNAILANAHKINQDCLYQVVR